MKFCLHYTLPTPIDIDPWVDRGHFSHFLKWRGLPVFCNFCLPTFSGVDIFVLVHTVWHIVWFIHCEFVVYEFVKVYRFGVFKICLRRHTVTFHTQPDWHKIPLYVILLLQTVLLLPCVPVKQVLSVCPNKHPDLEFSRLETPRTPNSDPWVEVARSDTYKVLHPLLEKVFCPPVTSAPVERIFSHSGLLMRANRARMRDNMLSQLVYLRCNNKL